MAHQIDSIHNEAMTMVSQAMIVKQLDREKYTSLMNEALKLEEKAAYLLYDHIDAEPARSILFQSAANIASEVELYDKACKLIYAALSGTPPQHIVCNLHDLLESIQFSRHLNYENIEVSANSINVSMYGNLVGNGIVLYDVFKRKVDAIEKMVLRTIQRLKFPDCFSSNKIYELRKQYPIFVQSVGKGCLSVGLMVGLDEKNESNLVDREILDMSIKEFTKGVQLLNNENYEELKSMIGNDDYYKSITEIYQEILPDGTNISGVNISANIEDQPFDLFITKTKPSMFNEEHQADEMDVVSAAEKGSELVLEGYIKMADSTKKEPYVKLVQEDNKEYKVYLEEATIDNVVSSYWDEYVSLKVRKKGKEKLVYIGIQGT